MNRFGILAAAIGLTLAASPLAAQFQLHTWDSFESGSMAAGTLMLHYSKPENTRVVEYDKLGDPDMVTSAAKRECGRFGLQFTTDRTNRQLAVVSPVALNRKLLGEKGRALFQADIYIKGEADVAHTVAITAMGTTVESPLKAGAKSYTFYRFGILKNSRAYFSFSNNTPAPRIYLHQELSAIVPPESLASGGWHRFQLVLEGQQKVSCYVDGRPTSFSPLTEGTLTRLQPGIMITAPEDKPLTAFVDNLSIQWTPDPATPMPESPWLPSSMANTSTGQTWSIDLAEALAASRASNKPMLAMFFSPFSVACQQLNNDIFQHTAEAPATLEKFSLLRVDVNQLQGGTLSRKFNVTAVPTLLVLTPDGKEKARLTPTKDTKWAEIGPVLEAALTK